MIIKSYIAEKNKDYLTYKSILFYGPNLGLKNYFKKNIKSQFPDSETYEYNQDEVIKNEENFFSNLLNISLFEKKKLFIISQCSEKILNFIEKVIDQLSDQKIFLFSDQLDKKSKLRNFFEKSKKIATIACYDDTEISLKKIILEKLKDYSGVSTHNINMILQSSSLDRAKLENEIRKIEMLFTDKKINSLKLEQLLNLNENENFNVLKDAALNGNKDETNRFLSETIIENEKIIFYLNSINQRLNRINQIRLLSEKTIELSIEKVKPPIFWKDKPNIINQAKKWNTKKIDKISSRIFKLEMRLKTNANLNKKVLLQNLLIDICNFANS